MSSLGTPRTSHIPVRRPMSIMASPHPPPPPPSSSFSSRAVLTSLFVLVTTALVFGGLGGLVGWLVTRETTTSTKTSLTVFSTWPLDFPFLGTQLNESADPTYPKHATPGTATRSYEPTTSKIATVATLRAASRLCMVKGREKKNLSLSLPLLRCFFVLLPSKPMPPTSTPCVVVLYATVFLDEKQNFSWRAREARRPLLAHTRL